MSQYLTNKVRTLSLNQPEGERDPPAGTLDDIVKDLFSYLNKCEHLREAKRDAENKYNIRNEADGCWSEDDIKRAWGKTKGMGKESSRRNDLALVIMLQVTERQRRELSLLIEGGDISQNAEDLTNMLEQMKAQRERKRKYCPRPDVFGKAKKMEGKDSADLGSLGAVRPETQSSTYIRIPITEMLDKEPTFQERRAPLGGYRYKLIDGSPEAGGDIHRRKSYAMSFDNRTNNAKWVYEILNRETLAVNCKKQEGFEDPYDRGHLAAAANHRWCREAVNDANLSSNIAPQHKRLNRGPWKVFETWSRELSDLAKTRNVHVYSGPLYRRPMNPTTLLGKTVPSHFFKVIIVENEDGTVEEPECYLMPNEEPNYKTLTEYQTNIDNIEQISGLRFIERQPHVREDTIITVRLQGEDLTTTTRLADIQARICQNID